MVTADTAYVTLDAGLSSDAEGDALSFCQSVLCEAGAELDDGRAVSPALVLAGDCLCVDSIMVALVVSDGFDSTMCEAVVRTDDQRPPVIVMRAGPIVLWPPDHKHHGVTWQMMIVSAEDAGIAHRCRSRGSCVGSLYGCADEHDPGNARGLDGRVNE